MAWRKGLAGVGTVSASLAGAAYYYRPDPSDELVESHPDISRYLKSTKVRFYKSTVYRIGSAPFWELQWMVL